VGHDRICLWLVVCDVTLEGLPIARRTGLGTLCRACLASKGHSNGQPFEATSVRLSTSGRPHARSCSRCAATGRSRTTLKKAAGEGSFIENDCRTARFRAETEANSEAFRPACHAAVILERKADRGLARPAPTSFRGLRASWAMPACPFLWDALQSQKGAQISRGSAA
jgi:hypothetical protein